MALIKCPECGKEISDKSDKCVNCGYPLKTEDIDPYVWKTTEELLSERLVKESYEKDGWVPFLW